MMRALSTCHSRSLASLRLSCCFLPFATPIFTLHQAFFQYGGEEWKYWNELVLPQILKAQQPDGSWKPNGAAHNPSAGGDNVYATALCTLMLEVYYRYLKVGDREQRSLFDR